MSPLARAMLKIHAELAVKTPEQVDTKFLLALADEVGEASNLLSAAYLS